MRVVGGSDEQLLAQGSTNLLKSSHTIIQKLLITVSNYSYIGVQYKFTSVVRHKMQYLEKK